MRRLLPGHAVQDAPDLRDGFRRGGGIVDLLVVLRSEVFLKVGFSNADAPADADGAELGCLDVSTDSDWVQAKTLCHVVDS